MKRFFCIIIITLAVGIPTLSANEPFSASVLRNLLLRIRNQPQEKVYLQTDRDHYMAGERVWFRAYLSDAVTHKPSTYSRYVYVELVDRKDKVWQRVKIRGVDSVYAGYIPLPKVLQQGEFFLRAYSYCMQNVGEDYIFKKKIRVINVRDSKIHTKTKYNNEKEGIVLEIQFIGPHGEIYKNTLVEYIINKNTRVQRTDENGIIRMPEKEWEENGDAWDRMKSNLPKKSHQKFQEIINTWKKRNVLVRFKNDTPVEFERELYLPKQKRDFDIQFFPEGGNLIAGSMQTVAFKAIRTDGFAEDIEGYLYNERDEYVAAIKSIHKGMGGFDFRPEAGRRYHAVVMSADSIRKTIDLPLPKRDGIALKVWTQDSTLTYSVLMGDSVQIPDSLYLCVLSRGVPLSCTPVIKRVGKLPLQMLPEGIIHLALMNSRDEIYSQRLCFVRKKNRPELSLEADKKSYIIRDLVCMSVDVLGEPGQELNGSFSVSVTDNAQCERDSTDEHHILSYLLLTSDLKGYVEDPAFYFRNVDRITNKKLDLLMLTQGWSRFDLPQVIRGELPDLPYYLEKGQAISGKVKNLWDKDAVNAELFAFSLSGRAWIAKTDSSGRFMVDGIAFPDSTQFIIQATTQKGGQTVELIIDKDRFLRPSIKFPYNFAMKEKEDDFYKKFARNYYYDKGTKVYILDEVTVKPRKKSKTYSVYDRLASYAIDSEQLVAMADWDIRQVLEKIPNVWVDDGDRKIYRGHKELLLIVNDKSEDFNFIMNFKPTDLVYVSYLDEFQARMNFKEKAPGGALVFSTGPNFIRDRSVPRLNISVTTFLGYQRRAKFYTPRYDVDSVRQALVEETDERQTIYWNPNIRTNKAGKAEFSFYTSDSYGPYTVIVEGILNDGTVYRKERKVLVKLQ